VVIRLLEPASSLHSSGSERCYHALTSVASSHSKRPQAVSRLEGYYEFSGFIRPATRTVVIKLFQESHLRDGPSIEDIWGEVDYAEWLPGARLAANEAWAYDRTRAL
jgi:hypothetical protein